MEFFIASQSENLIWKRVRENGIDPGLVLSYGFYLYGTIQKSVLINVFANLLQKRFSNILCHFSEHNGVLYKKHNLTSIINVEELDHIPDLSNACLIDHLSEQLYYVCYHIIDKETCFIGLQFSHLVFDGNSYEEFCQGFEEVWKEIKYPEKENLHSINANNFEKTTGEIKFAEYWARKVKDVKLSYSLPFAKSNKNLKNRFLSIKKYCRGEEYQTLVEKLSKENCTLFQLIFCVFSATLLKYDAENSDTISISHTVSTRKHGQPLGCYLNVIPVAIPNQLCWTPNQFLGWIKKERKKTKSYQDFPLEEILKLASEKLNRGGELLNVIVNHSQGLLPLRSPKLEGLEVELCMQPSTGGPYDLALNFSFNDSTLCMSFDASADVVNYQVLNTFSKNFFKTLHFFITNSEKAINELKFSDGLLPVIAGEKINRPNAELSTLLIKQCKHQSNKTAIVCKGCEYTYGDLLEMSLLLSSKLISDIPEEDLKKGVGLFLSRTELLPVALLTCILLEVPFVPIEPSTPAERINNMIEVSGVRVILTDEVNKDTSLNLISGCICINIHKEHQKYWPNVNEVEQRKHGIELAYVMFTSGSTGVPKGVMISRANLLNFINSMQEMLPVSEKDYFLAITSIGFDISILELILPLFIGATLEIIDEEIRRSPVLLANKINNSPVTLVQTTPSIWRLLKSANWKAVRPLILLSGGEALEKEIAEYLLEQGGMVFNMYGPTEATIWASVQKVIDPNKIFLGKPIHHTDFFVVDEDIKSVDAGMMGELVITGNSIGLGYLNYDSSLVFVDSVFEKKAYLTGDYVRNIGDGQIEFIRRKNSYSKVNGYRIETDEVTAKLQTLYPEFEIVTVIRESPEPHLCCFYWSENQGILNEIEVLKALSSVLPYYMIPKRILPLKTLPLTLSGKLDAKKLAQEEDLSKLILDEVPTINQSKEIEEECFIIAQLKQILLEVLNVTVVDPSIPLGFLGLNSISYNQLSLAIQEKFSVKISTHEFYQLVDLNLIKKAIQKRSAPVSIDNKATFDSTKQSPYLEVANVATKKQKIAIIGYSVLLPQNLESEGLWQALIEKKSLLSYSQQLKCKAGFLDKDYFDASFFSISPLEALHMDPRQRLLLQTAWRTIEDAAYRASALKGKNVGCYIAATGNDYAGLQAKNATKQIPFSLAGYSASILSNRISNFFDWRGPSFTIDTACSGTLSALVKACNDLSFNICDAAFVGGVNLILDDQINDGLEAGQFLSPNYRCATYDTEADGYVRGEGLGGFLVKRLEDALRDGDHIHGVIESYVENHGGRSNSLTAPNPTAQTDLLLKAYTPKLASKLSYIETHGTGTRLGDPIEIDAIKRAWGKLVGSNGHNTIWLGAMKSNTGHLEAAAGVASLAKVLLALKYRRLPANIYFKELNPLINLDGMWYSPMFGQKLRFF